MMMNCYLIKYTIYLLHVCLLNDEEEDNIRIDNIISCFSFILFHLQLICEDYVILFKL